MFGSVARSQWRSQTVAVRTVNLEASKSAPRANLTQRLKNIQVFKASYPQPLKTFYLNLFGLQKKRWSDICTSNKIYNVPYTKYLLKLRLNISETKPISEGIMVDMKELSGSLLKFDPKLKSFLRHKLFFRFRSTYDIKKVFENKEMIKTADVPTCWTRKP